MKHQRPCKTKYGSVQGACGSWTLTWGSFLVSAYCGGKGGLAGITDHAACELQCHEPSLERRPGRSLARSER